MQGDEDTGSPKVSYALSFTSNLDIYAGQEFIVGAGFYRNFSTAEAETAAEDGSTGSAARWPARRWTAAPFGFGPGIASLAGASGNVGRAGLASFLPMPTGALPGGSSFQVTPGFGRGASLWGGGEIMRFNSGDGEGFGEGEVTTAAIGGDYVFGPLVTGLAVTYSSGSGTFELGRPGEDDVGDVSTTLTSAFPYARLSISDRLFTWGVLGYGSGQLGIEGGGEADPDSDITMHVAGLGLKGEFIRSEAPAPAGCG